MTIKCHWNIVLFVVNGHISNGGQRSRLTWNDTNGRRRRLRLTARGKIKKGPAGSKKLFSSFL
jgi:hypothetical protein